MDQWNNGTMEQWNNGSFALNVLSGVSTRRSPLGKDIATWDEIVHTMTRVISEIQYRISQVETPDCTLMDQWNNGTIDFFVLIHW